MDQPFFEDFMGVFVSYSRQDSAEVQRLTEVFSLAGEEVWLDQSIRGGEAWWQAILREIRACDVFIFALSQTSARSKHCLAEQEYARSLGLPILAVQIGPVESLRLTPFADSQVLDFQTDARDAAIRLVTTVNRKGRERTPLPSPLPPEPAEPFAYLGQIFARVSTGAHLNPREQAGMLAELEWALEEDGDDDLARKDVLTLLERLRRRQDATFTIRSRIDRLIASVRHREPHPTARTTFSALPDERRLLELGRRPSAWLGDLDLKCKLLPAQLWASADRAGDVFYDDPEQLNRVELQLVDAPLPKDSLSQLLSELREAVDSNGRAANAPTQHEKFEEIFNRLTKEGNTAYPRVVAPPVVHHDNDGKTLVIALGPSRYGIALIEEWKLPLQTAETLRSEHALTSLGVRVAVTYRHHGQLWTEVHQRQGGSRNATYHQAWDVGAAGYIDPSRHTDPEDESTISPWQACASEIEEELNIPKHEQQNREHFYFFGMARNDLTGQLDLVAACHLAHRPDPARRVTPRVNQYDRCALTPESVADFVVQKQYWVPTAVLALVLLLHAHGYPMARIEAAFAVCPGKLRLDP